MVNRGTVSHLPFCRLERYRTELNQSIAILRGLFCAECKPKENLVAFGKV